MALIILKFFNSNSIDVQQNMLPYCNLLILCYPILLLTLQGITKSGLN